MCSCCIDVNYCKLRNVKTHLTLNTLITDNEFENAIKKSSGDFIFLCDQDDVWHPDKLILAVNRLRVIDNDGLYYHAMDLVDSNLEKYDFYFRNEKFSIR